MVIRNTYKKKKTYEADARCAEIGNKKYLYAQFPVVKKRKIIMVKIVMPYSEFLMNLMFLLKKGLVKLK
jgi:hypothetical protein